MKDKTSGVALQFIFWLIAGILNYRGYVHLLNEGEEAKHFFAMFTVVSFCMFIISGVELIILRSKDEN